ncbi:hypothetical protein SAMN04515674_101439 [Pseudarcicella hirudinis]|uniref:Uncharacterized protein n=1 Tax=Pseudarcicella hirudinis TaxID=1079859 RepID=A0A1I5MTA7_9BACT|nr:hypothetical protein [Pseudarcicella hirudinis]SFP12793.1 hypothetical protein SAMN04515674_101439 [Pseudarcicella hirudinis]
MEEHSREIVGNLYVEAKELFSEIWANIAISGDQFEKLSPSATQKFQDRVDKLRKLETIVDKFNDCFFIILTQQNERLRNARKALDFEDSSILFPSIPELSIKEKMIENLVIALVNNAKTTKEIMEIWSENVQLLKLTLTYDNFIHLHERVNARHRDLQK